MIQENTETLLDSLCRAASILESSGLSDKKLVKCEDSLTRIQNYLSCSPSEALFFTIIYAVSYSLSRPPDLSDIACFINFSTLDILRFKPVLDSLEAKGLIISENCSSEFRSRKKKSIKMTYLDVVFTVAPAVSQSIINNLPLSANIAGGNEDMDNYDFVKEVSNLLEQRSDGDISTRKLFDEVKRIEDQVSLDFVKSVKLKISKVESRTLFCEICDDFINSSGKNSSLDVTLNEIYDRKRDCIRTAKQLADGSHPLIVENLIALTNGELFSDAEMELTDNGKAFFLGNDFKLFQKSAQDNRLLLPEKIKTKQLYYVPELQRQVELLQNSLQETEFSNLGNRLSEMNLPQGVCALFYGTPGTGKTETALQLAKVTGRAIMQVDISRTKSCWFGESEKIIKRVFRDYREICKDANPTPILLFNEAEAVLSKRKNSNASNVAQTENAIQNIILQEMESLEGILIATTNLVNNLDSAFERRFLFKIKFDKPATEAKMLIWKSKMAWLTEDEVQTLAQNYDFSGGEIDNIVRKATMTELIEGKKPSFKELLSICSAERISD